MTQQCFSSELDEKVDMSSRLDLTRWYFDSLQTRQRACRYCCPIQEDTGAMKKMVLIGLKEGRVPLAPFLLFESFVLVVLVLRDA